MHDTNIINCWKSIGVWGKEKPRCPILKEIIHCRNCEKFLVSGILTLNRPLPEEYKKEWTELLASNGNQKSVSRSCMLVFCLNSTWFSLPSTIFTQISTFRPIRILPHRRNEVLIGLVHISGEILLSFSLHNLLGLQKDSTRNISSEKYLAVIEASGQKFAFPINEISGLYGIDTGSRQDTPEQLPPFMQYVSGIILLKELTVYCLDEKPILQLLDKSIV